MSESFKDPETGLTFVVDEGDNLGLPLEESNSKAVQSKVGAEASDEEEEQEKDGEGDEEEVDTSEDSDDEEYDLEEVEGELDNYLAAEIEKTTKPLLAGRDRQISKLAEQNKALQDAQAALQKEIRDTKLTGMLPEERARMQAIYDLDDRKAQLDQYQASTDDLYLSVLRVAYVSDYGEFGITEDDLEGLSEEQMDVLVKDKELEYWRNVAQGKVPSPQAKQTSAGKPRDLPKKEAPAPRKAPAGASAPSDLGGGGGADTPQKGGVDPDQGIDALARSLKSAPMATIRFRQ